MVVRWCLIAVVGWVAGCGIDPARVPVHPVLAGDQDRLELDGPVRFGVVGASWGDPSSGATEVVADLVGRAGEGDLSFVVFMGDQVRRSTTGAWEEHAVRWRPLWETGARAVALAGRGERRRDQRLIGFGAAYPDSAPVGHQRGGAWRQIDLVIDGVVWRLLIVDTASRELGDLWTEERYWLPRAVRDGYDHLLVFSPEPAITLSRLSDPADPAAEILATIRDHAPPERVMGIFQGGAATNELHLPDGRWGQAVVVAGNSGVEPVDLARWRPVGPGAEVTEVLAAGFDRALREEAELWAAAEALDAEVVETTWGADDVEPNPGALQVIPAAAFPVRGWWQVAIEDGELELGFRMRRYDGTVRLVFSTRYRREGGWTTERINAPR